MPCFLDSNLAQNKIISIMEEGGKYDEKRNDYYL